MLRGVNFDSKRIEKGPGQCPQPAGLTYSHLQVYLQSRPGIG